MKTKNQIRCIVKKLIRKYDYEQDLIRAITGLIIEVSGEAQSETSTQLDVKVSLIAKLMAIEEIKQQLKDGNMGRSSAYGNLLQSLNKLESEYKQTLHEYKDEGKTKSKRAKGCVEKIKGEWRRSNIIK